MKSIGGKTFCFDFYFCLFLILFVTAGFFICPKVVWASGNDLIITEIMYDPSGVMIDGKEKKTEWIELYANKDVVFVKYKENNKNKVENFYICAKKGETGCAAKRISFIYFPEGKDSLLIKKGEFFIVAKDTEAFKEKYTEKNKIITLKSDSYFDLLGNTSENAFVAFSNDEEIKWEDNINYYDPNNKIAKGYSLEKIDFDEKDYRNNWQESYVSGGTPGEKNSEKPEPKKYSSQIRINEILPNPSGDESKDEYVELYNFSNEDVDLEGWELKDAGTGKYIFPKNTSIKNKDYFVVYRKDSKISINNSDEKITLLSPNGLEVSAVSYKDKSFNSDISYSFDGVGWRKSSFLTHGKENKFDEAQNIKIKKDEKIHKNVYANFEVKIKDKKQKVVWDFGDGRKSYLQETKHKYLNTGTFEVSLTVKGKSDDLVENFTVEVEKFGESKINIISVKANPKGKDTKLESIVIKNNSKKKINLEGWSIATGWDNLYNHPITKKLVIKPGKSKEITKKYSAFTLNNKQTKIELRRPDGTVAAKVKYSKKEGVQDDEIYEKTDNGWAWNAPVDTNDMQANTNKTQNSADIVPDKLENTNENTEEILSNDENNQVEDNSEIQSDEPVENGEVLGIETKKENIIDNDNNEIGLFMAILFATNRTINNFINFFF